MIARRLHGLAEKGVDVAEVVDRALGEGPLPNERPASALWWRVAGIARVWQGWPPSPRTEDVWETVTPTPRRRPEQQHLPGYGHDRHGPSIGF